MTRLIIDLEKDKKRKIIFEAPDRLKPNTFSVWLTNEDNEDETIEEILSQEQVLKMVQFFVRHLQIPEL